MTRMHNPLLPVEILEKYPGGITAMEAAVNLGVDRVTLSRIVTGSLGISADMAYRLGEAFGTRRASCHVHESSDWPRSPTAHCAHP